MNTTKDNEILTLIDLTDNAAKTYKEVSEDYSDKDIEHFLDKLANHHKAFVQKVKNSNDLSDNLPIKNQLKPDAIFDKRSAIDLLLLCKEIEKKILDQAREAIHSSDANTRRIICQQLSFSEKALFRADSMLEDYE